MKMILVFIALIVVSCSQSKEQTSTKKLESAQVAINEGRFNDAINILETFSEVEKKQMKVIDLLSSAYAGRAGFSSFIVYDLLEQNKNNPEKALFKLAEHFYSMDSIKDSQKALDYIYSLSSNPDERPLALNVKYSTIQVYKISQILIKNIKKFEETDSYLNWNPCEEVNLLSLDIRDILISTNRAVIAIKNLQENIYNQLLSIQRKYNINPQVFEEEVINKTDINKVRVSIGESYSEIIGTSTISCGSL